MLTHKDTLTRVKTKILITAILGLFLIQSICWADITFSLAISDGTFTLSAKNNSKPETMISFKRDCNVVFLPLTPTGDIIRDPSWVLNSVRGMSHGFMFHKIPYYGDNFVHLISQMRKSHFTKIAEWLKAFPNESLFLLAILKFEKDQSYKLVRTKIYKIENLNASNVNFKEGSEFSFQIVDSICEEIKKIENEENSPDYIPW